MVKINPTRGYGLLENFLAKQRAKITNYLLGEKMERGRILDIGCGHYPLFLRKIKFKQKYGIDKTISKKDINKYYGIKLIPYDIEKEGNLPFQSNYFDIVTMLAVFEHLEPNKLIPILKEIKRVLKNGGIFIMTTPAGWADKILKFLAKLNLVSHQEIEEHKDGYNQTKILRILRESGYKKNKVEMGYFEANMNIWVKAKCIK